MFTLNPPPSPFDGELLAALQEAEPATIGTRIREIMAKG